MAEPAPTHRERLNRARAAGTYEDLRPQLTELLANRHLSFAMAAAALGMATKTVRMAAAALRISNVNANPGKGLVTIIRAYTADWDRGW
jgi:hypothetical protein